MLSVSLSCLIIKDDGSSDVLRPNPVFIPKDITVRSRGISLEGFSLLPTEMRWKKHHTAVVLMLVLSHYITCTADRKHSREKPLIKQGLAHWQ